MFEVIVRLSLWLSFQFNLGAAYVFAMPSSWLGRLFGLPADVDLLYACMLALLVALFGFAYAWLALQANLNRPLLCLGAIGKTGVFLLALVLWYAGAVTPALLAAATGDLAFAVLWFYWLLQRG